MLSLVSGVGCGLSLLHYIGLHEPDSATTGQSLAYATVALLIWRVAYHIQIATHEAGHLVFGLATGYKFRIFGVRKLALVKQNGKIRLKRYSLPGAAGFCGMTPPDPVDGKVPVFLFWFGGCISDLLVGATSAVLFAVFYNYFPLGVLFFTLAFYGFLSAFISGIPIRMKLTQNDGYSATFIRNDPKAIRSFCVQAKAMECISNGVRLKDMPGEWFEMPSDEEMKNGMIASMGAFVCNRLMDERRLAEADVLMEKLLSEDNAISSTDRALMICDRIYIEAIGENRRERINTMLTKEQKQLMKTMKSSISVIRTEYVYALLVERDTKKAEKLKADFEKRKKSYPYEVDVESESELVATAERISKERSAQSGYFSYVT